MESRNMLEDAATYRCPQCPHQSVWGFQLDHHIKRNHKNIDAVELMKPVIVAKLELYPCVGCDYKSHCKLRLYEHCISKHDAKAPASVRDETIESQLHELARRSCDYCNFKTRSSLSLIKHHDSCKMELKDPIESVTLPDAYESFRYTLEAYNSIKVQHLNSTVSPLAQGFQCIKCPYKGKTKSSLTRHMIKHAAVAEIKWWNCTKCSYRAKRKSNLIAHVKVMHATGDAWWNCTKCSYRAKRKSNLIAHVKVMHATGDAINWFSCTKCPYRAKQKGTLKIHMVHTHTAAVDDFKWFICTQCSYRGKQKGHLKNHMLKHAPPDDVPWFTCATCSYRTIEKGNLKKHMLMHVATKDIKWIQCTNCAYRSKTKSTLKRHMLSKHASAEDIQWFECTKCFYHCKIRGDLKRHMLRHALDEEAGKKREK